MLNFFGCLSFFPRGNSLSEVYHTPVACKLSYQEMCHIQAEIYSFCQFDKKTFTFKIVFSYSCSPGLGGCNRGYQKVKVNFV